jgi:hypothetical protein
MDSSKLQLMQQWQTVMGIMGLDLEEIMDNAWNDDSQFLDTLEQYLVNERRRAEQDPVYMAVMRTIEMGISDDDIIAYHEHLETIEEKAKAAHDQMLVNTNPAIAKLRTVHGFRITNSKQYPNHVCFSFVVNGIVVNGRCFRPDWSYHRVWTTWRDKSNIAHKQKWEPKHTTYPPKAFPAPWQARATTEILCYMMAYYMVTPTSKLPEPHLERPR